MTSDPDSPDESAEQACDDVQDVKKPWPQRLLRMFRNVLLYALVVSVAMIVFASLRGPNLPDRAPDFALPNLDGEIVQLADFRGKAVLLNFWATWCLPCRIEAPALSRLASSRSGLVVLGIAADGTPSELQAAAEELGINYTILRGDRVTLDAYSVDTFPTTVVVGPEGDVKRTYTGLLLDPQLWWAVR